MKSYLVRAYVDVSKREVWFRVARRKNGQGWSGSRTTVTSPHYARATSRDRMARGRVICSTKAHSRVIDSGEGGRGFRRDCGGKPGRPSFRRRKVDAPDALCFADDPASGAASFCTVGSRASSGLAPCGVPTRARLRSESRGTAGWSLGGTTISTISLRRLVHNAG